MKYGPVITGKKAVLASGHYLATQAGMQIAAIGGNAVDIGVAAGFALAVLKPCENSFGGECPIIIYSPKEQKTVAISGMGYAPRRATIEWFEENEIPLIPGIGYLPATVPGLVGAYLCALKRYGTLPLSEVLAPAYALARDGFPVYGRLHNTIKSVVHRLTHDWPTGSALYLHDGKVPEVGSCFKNPALADTIQKLITASSSVPDREAGIDAAENCFYRGEIAKEIINFSHNNPCIDSTGRTHKALLDLEDFAQYQTIVEPTVFCDYKQYTIHKCSAWTQGPVFLHQLKLLEGFDLSAMGHNSVEYIHTLTECAKIAFADRERFYGDPLMSDFSIDSLLDPERIGKQITEINPNKGLETIPQTRDEIIRAANIPAETQKEAIHDTTHFDVCDADGLMMSATPSGGWLSASPLIPSLGFQLGTRGQNFGLRRGHPNALAPRKRPRCTLTPTLAFRDGKPWMVFGTPGGDKQDQLALQFFLNVVEFNMDIRDAMDAPSFFTNHFLNSFYPRQAELRSLYLDREIDYDTMLALQDKGHIIRLLPGFTNGQMNAAALENDWITGAACSKLDGQGYAVGW